MTREHFWSDPERDSIKVKVWCPFCGSQIVIDMQHRKDSWGQPTGTYHTMLFCRESKDIPGSYATLEFPSINRFREQHELESIKRQEKKREIA